MLNDFPTHQVVEVSKGELHLVLVLNLIGARARVGTALAPGALELDVSEGL